MLQPIYVFSSRLSMVVLVRERFESRSRSPALCLRENKWRCCLCAPAERMNSVVKLIGSQSHFLFNFRKRKFRQKLMQEEKSQMKKRFSVWVRLFHRLMNKMEFRKMLDV